MSTNILSLPRELRNKIYEELLVCESFIEIDSELRFLPRNLTQGLLFTCRTIHGEATSVFYAQNSFEFDLWDAQGLLNKIGPINASYIRHIATTFPSFYDLEPSSIELEASDSQDLLQIQNDCTSLITLETDLESTNTWLIKLDGLDNLNIVAEALALVNSRFRAIPSLQSITVNLYEEGPGDYIRGKMMNHGWTINTTENPPSDDDGNDVYQWLDPPDDYDDDSDYSVDNYDIDNDSDFWRRAGDDRISL
ncbi:uncharacterized protein EAF01_004271 [Botrytis porri]|uniref:Uncharacterized protein n=1 Tax=Botrytis porri TaxID=87229 RepID=A0A4Z1KLH9_9HELO|nr:uncharacterized protein EAF01_004271 [Botrytis porri]KAF7908516.1 hypothetical protein EAF01_004271 [Botrytis porri]TGO86903.1 hypothetical protein BPOR_0267g00020 [Botrytis porri]